MLNRRQFDVDITSIRRKENSRHFDLLFPCNYLMGKKSISFRRAFFDVNSMSEKIGVASTYFLRCNFDDQKIDVFLTYFAQHNFDERNIDVISKYSFQLNFDGRKINFFSVYFLCYLEGKMMRLRIFWCSFKRQKVWSFCYLFLISFCMLKIKVVWLSLLCLTSF